MNNAFDFVCHILHYCAVAGVHVHVHLVASLPEIEDLSFELPHCLLQLFLVLCSLGVVAEGFLVVDVVCTFLLQQLVFSLQAANSTDFATFCEVLLIKACLEFFELLVVVPSISCIAWVALRENKHLVISL